MYERPLEFKQRLNPNYPVVSIRMQNSSTEGFNHIHRTEWSAIFSIFIKYFSTPIVLDNMCLLYVRSLV